MDHNSMFMRGRGPIATSESFLTKKHEYKYNPKSEEENSPVKTDTCLSPERLGNDIGLPDSQIIKIDDELHHNKYAIKEPEIVKDLIRNAFI